MKPTQEQVIAWAREAGFEVYEEDKFMNTHISDTLIHIHTAAENLATLAYEAGRKDENEACVEEIRPNATPMKIAAAIRARREQ